MKTRKRIISVVSVLLIAVCLTACGNKAGNSSTADAEQTAAEKATKEDLYGTWKGTEGEISTVSFSKDGNYKDDAGDNLYIIGTYTVDEDAQTITVNESEYGMVFVYDFQISGNKLTIQMDGGLPRHFLKN